MDEPTTRQEVGEAAGETTGEGAGNVLATGPCLASPVGAWRDVNVTAALSGLRDGHGVKLAGDQNRWGTADVLDLGLFGGGDVSAGEVEGQFWRPARGGN